MLIIPAIDLKGGRCVRLTQGRAEDETVYSADPVQTALAWVAQGAQRLHVVDLDGAFAGRPAHADLIGRIARAARVPVQAGGGLRRDEDIDALLAAGAECAIVGTRALAGPDELARLCRRYGPRLAVGIDARNGMAQVRGWTETTAVRGVDLAAQAAAAGASAIIYTDTATDGMLAGPNLRALDEICGAAACRVIASGGISRAEDVRMLRALRRPNLAGTIVGKALYERRVALADLIRAASREEDGAAR